MLRGLKTTTMARVLPDGKRGGPTEARPATALRRGDIVLAEAGDMIPGDGEVIEGVASVDESAITGNSRVWRRLLLRDRRHTCAVGLDRGADHD